MEKIVLITGANSGIGRAAAIKFAQEGYTVIMGCRNLGKSKKVQDEIISLTNNDKVDLLELDISSFESIKKFCANFQRKYSKLDILINNAAYFKHSEKNYLLSLDHIEIGFASNVVGPFLLITLLTPMLKKSWDGRVLNACTTNIRHFLDPKRTIDFDNLQGENKESKAYSSYKMYGDSKMALFILTKKMAELLKEQAITVNAIQIPAIKISKETIRQFKSAWRLAARIQNLFSASQESMADTYFDICTSDRFKDVTGKLINDKREIMQTSQYKTDFVSDVKQFFDKGIYPKYADNVENIERVWNFCVRLTNINGDTNELL